MARKVLVILILAALVATGAFAQKNSITYDVGPTLVGLGFNALENIIPEDGVSGNGLGFAFQYERNLFKMLSVAGRFAYLSINGGYTDNSYGINLGLDMNMSSYSIEGHVRYYPFFGSFFLDGTLGYANFSAAFNGQALIDNIPRVISFDESGNYMKVGAKIGWRISLGSNGGFTIEPAFGYYHGIALGDSVGQKFSDRVPGEGDVKNLFDMFEKLMFVGGPRLSLGFGWSF